MSPMMMLSPGRPASARPYRRRNKAACPNWSTQAETIFQWEHPYDVPPFETRGIHPFDSPPSSGCSPSSCGSSGDTGVEVDRFRYPPEPAPEPLGSAIAARTARMAQYQNQQMRSFNIDSQGRIIDCGFRMGQNGYTCRQLTRTNKNRRATCPEIWLSSEDGHREVMRSILRIYGAESVGKKTIARQMIAHADYTASKEFLTDGDDLVKRPAQTISFIMNDNEVELEIIQGSALESDPFQNVLTLYLVVYSVSNRDSFVRAAQILYRLYDQKRGFALPVVLVANKADLQRKRKVTSIEGKMLAKIYKCAFVEVSALLSVNMESVWQETLKKLQKYRTARERAEGERRRRHNSQNRLIGRIVHHGRRFARSCEAIVARIAQL